MKPKIYLSGPISGLTYADCTTWREYVSARVPGCISPLRGKEFLRTVGVIGGSYEQHPFASAKSLTTRDRYDVLTCDIMFCYLLGAESISIGTMIEVGWADGARIPIVLVMEEEALHTHPILETCAGYVCRTLDEGIACVQVLLS